MKQSKTRHVICAVAVILVLVAAVSYSRADIAPDPLTTGGTSLTNKDKAGSVKMVWEDVDLYPSPEKNQVEVVFGMKNGGDKDIELEVGFPSYYNEKLNDFKLEIDGKELSWEIKKEGSVGSKRQFKYWVCWTMKFTAGVEHKVKVSYWVKTERVFSQLRHRNLPDELKEKLWGYKSGYVLRTGAGWSGKIGKAVIRIHYNDSVKKSLLEFCNNWGQPHTELSKDYKYDKKSNIDTITLLDFEPNASSDINYSFKLCTVPEKAEILDKALKEKKLDPWAQQYLLKLVEDKNNPLGLSTEEKEKRITETLEWIVPPIGPEVDQTKISRGAEKILRDVYHRLFDYYLTSKQEEKAKAIAPYYQKFAEFILDRDIKLKDNKWYRVEYLQLEKMYTKVMGYIE